jgi:hypothetical protein
VLGTFKAMAVMARGRPWPPAADVLGSRRSPWRSLDGCEIAILAVFAALSVWVLAFDLWHAAAPGHVWTGTDGLFPVDQLQYMAWVRDASHHLLVSDMYVLRPTPHDYLEPLVALAGGLTALGMAPWAALLVFQPVAVGAIFFAIRGYVNRSLSGRWERRAALVLALFFGSFVVLYGPFGPVADEWIPFWTWGYLPGVFSIAALVGALVAYDRGLRERRVVWLAPALGLLSSWLHPWQGVELLAILVMYELTGRTRIGRRYLVTREQDTGSSALPALTVLATLLPLIYYALLDRLDPIWHMAQAPASLHRSPATVLVPLVPLLVGMALGWRGRPRGFLGSATRLWPLAALGEYAVCEAGFGPAPLHAVAGISIPLAVLTVRGGRRIGLERVPGHRWIAALAVAAVTLPAGIYLLTTVPKYVRTAFIFPDAARAVSYLARDPRPGGVLTTWKIGAVIPSETGRRTYIGEDVWSLPHPRHRSLRTWWLFFRDPGPVPARNFVFSTGARFILAPCQSRTNLAHDLAPILASVHRFGCATLYTLRGAGRRA